jgi:hypothetical protein
MPASLAALCNSFESGSFLVPLEDRRQTTDRRQGHRGGRRASDAPGILPQAEELDTAAVGVQLRY